MAVDLESFIPMLTGGGGGILFAGLSKVLMRREDRAEKAEHAEREERKLLMSVVQTQAENLGYMKAEIDTLKTDLKDCNRQHEEARQEMADLRARLDRDSIA